MLTLKDNPGPSNGLANLFPGFGRFRKMLKFEASRNIVGLGWVRRRSFATRGLILISIDCLCPFLSPHRT